jgi:hypothetical protein
MLNVCFSTYKGHKISVIPLKISALAILGPLLNLVGILLRTMR